VIIDGKLIKIPRTVKNLRESGQMQRALRRLRSRRDLWQLGTRYYRKPNLCMSVATRKVFRPGSRLWWPMWRLWDETANAKPQARSTASPEANK
jgi:hypothetical protein